jgi:hypothetical protein
MLSPLWKVEKERDGSFIAKPRSVGQDWPSDGNGAFLFEFMADRDIKLPNNYRIHNQYLVGDKAFSSFRITAVFQKPDLARASLGASRLEVTIPVHKSFESKIGPNSSSDLAIRLSTRHEVYVILHEQGAHPRKTTTFAKVVPAMKDLARLADSPQGKSDDLGHAGFYNGSDRVPAPAGAGVDRHPRSASRDFKCKGVTLTVRETASIQRIAASGIRRASAVSAAMPPLPATCDNV